MYVCKIGFLLGVVGQNSIMTVVNLWLLRGSIECSDNWRSPCVLIFPCFSCTFSMCINPDSSEATNPVWLTSARHSMRHYSNLSYTNARLFNLSIPCEGGMFKSSCLNYGPNSEPRSEIRLDFVVVLLFVESFGCSSSDALCAATSILNLSYDFCLTTAWPWQTRSFTFLSEGYCLHDS